MAEPAKIQPSGQICIAPNAPLGCAAEPADGMLCSLPASNNDEAIDFLETIGGGQMGSGFRLSQLGVDMPKVRVEYERLVKQLEKQVKRMRLEGRSTQSIARFAVEQRRNIANTMRMKTGVGTRVLFEVRDWAEYGPGGRTLRNVEARYLKRGLTDAALDEAMIAGALSPNTGISNTAIRGARYLRHGGRVIFVIGLASTAYTLMTTPPEKMRRVLAQEGGGFLGGGAGSAAAVGACLVFGVATGGWGLLACGFVGGVAGGAAGQWLGDRAYLAATGEVEKQMSHSALLDPNQLVSSPPPPMCVAPYTR